MALTGHTWGLHLHAFPRAQELHLTSLGCWLLASLCCRFVCIQLSHSLCTLLILTHRLISHFALGHWFPILLLGLLHCNQLVQQFGLLFDPSFPACLLRACGPGPWLTRTSPVSPVTVLSSQFPIPLGISLITDKNNRHKKPLLFNESLIMRQLFYTDNLGYLLWAAECYNLVVCLLRKTNRNTAHSSYCLKNSCPRALCEEAVLFQSPSYICYQNCSEEVEDIPPLHS